MSATYLKAIASRRTIYNLKPELPTGVTVENVKEVVQAIIKETPTAFNSQSNRAVILTGETHKQVWDAVVKALPNEDTARRPASVRDEAYGSVIFFTDDKIVDKLKTDFPAWAEAFPKFADHTSGAAQINSWTTLESLGLGAHLQHYNPLVKAALPAKIPAEWSVVAQLCFGTPTEAAAAKTYIANEVEIFN